MFYYSSIDFFFFFQAEDGIRDHCVTGVQTCALPIWERGARGASRRLQRLVDCRLELAVELHSLRVGKRQDLGHDQAGDLLGRIEPVVRVVETAPAERAGAAAVGPGLEIHHVAEAAAEVSTGEEA